MSERQVNDSGQIGETLQRLSRQVSSEHSDSPAFVFQQSLDRIARERPFTAAAILVGEPGSGDPAWSYEDSGRRGNQYFAQLTSDRPELLSAMRTEQGAVQHDLGELIPDSGMEGRCFLIGVPAGRLDDEPCSLGVLSKRRLRDEEIDQLTSFSRLLGMAAENARLTGLLQPYNGQSPANLIGLIAHELRTPLTGMRGNIQLALMSNQKGKTERVPERLEAAITSIDGMAELVQKLLDVSRLERGNFQLHPAHADLRRTAAAAVDSVLGGTEMDHEVIRLSGDRPVEHRHDQHALELALTYLLRTALEYREPDSPITLDVRPKEQASVIEISYAGEPLSAFDRDALDSPLYARQPRSTAADGQSLQLDLAYVRGVVLYHDGWITIHSSDSDSPRQVITIRFPAGPSS